MKSLTETFEEAYNHFISQADQKTLRVIANVQYFYECSDGVKAEREKAKKNCQHDHAEPDDNNKTTFDMDFDDAKEIEEIEEGIFLEEITDDDIERARLMRTAVLRKCSQPRIRRRILQRNSSRPHIHIHSQADKGEKIRTWETQLKAATREQMNKFGTINITKEPNEVQASIAHVESAGTSPEVQPRAEGQPLAGHIRQGYIERLELSNLNEEQRRAHDIIEERLVEHITSES